MKSILLFIFIIFPLLRPAEFKAKVTSIKDGDTIEVLHENKATRIRLNGIDCPEKDQDFGKKAKQFTSDFCFGKEVKVISYGEDRYGRTLGDIVLEDGRNLNQELVKAGLAWHYKKYSSDPTLANLEIQARNQKIGLWLQPNALAPWDFRNEKREEDYISMIDKGIRQGKFSSVTVHSNTQESPCEETLYLDSDKIQKIEKGCGDGSVEMTKEHYYLKNNDLVLFKVERHIFNASPTYTKERAIKDGATAGWFDPSKTVILITNYYFEKSKLTRVVGEEMKKINNSDDYQKREKQIISSLNATIATFENEKK